MQSWQPPRSRTELASFFGFANYYREFVKDFATKAFSMSSLMRKAAPFQWTPEAQDSFDSVKQALVDATALALPASEGRFVLDTDASTVGISGILHQEQQYNGKNRVETDSLWKPCLESYADEVWSSEVGNVSRSHLREEVPFVSSS